MWYAIGYVLIIAGVIFYIMSLPALFSWAMRRARYKAILEYRKGEEVISTRLSLQNGVCAGRWNCKNNNKDVCKPLPKNKENFIECDYYERKVVA